MEKSSTRKSKATFVIEPSRLSHLEAIAGWVGTKSWYFRPWRSRKNDHSMVMTMNRRPVAYLSLLQHNRHSGDIYVLPSPQLERSFKLVLRVWYMVSVYAFLTLELSKVYASVRVDSQEENEVLQLLGYRMVDPNCKVRRRTNEYICSRKEFKMVM
ncbi:MAG TPA: hypothetical protein VHD83_13455 [Puia sp.]|nr:hypothetical protein [Puia sp.]